MKLTLPKLKLSNLPAVLRRLPDRPTTARGWFLVGALTLTVLYLFVGLYFIGRLYIGGRIIPAALSYYPLPAARVGASFIPVARYHRDLTAINRYIAESGTQEAYQSLNVPRQVMNRLVDAALFDRLAHRYGVVVTAAEVETAYQQAVTEESEPVERVLEQYYNFTPADFKVWVAEFLLEEKVRAEVPKRRTIEHILVAVDASADEASVKTAEDKANSLAQKIRDGADFATTARQESNDVSSRDQGGSLGEITRGVSGTPVIDQPFEDAAFAAPLNELTGPVRSGRGWHLIRVTGEKGIVDRNMSDIIKDERAATTVTILLPLPQ